MPDVFLSYNREDRPRASLVAEGLVAEGLSVWWDTALRAGENYDEVTERNLREASAVVVLWSKRSVQSKWVRAEATLGQRKSALVPAMIEDCDRPLLFELIQTTDLVKWEGERSDPEWRLFIDVIKARVVDSAKRAQAAAAPAAAAASAHSAAALSDSKTKHLEAATALHAATIETTFWQSIKDGNNVHDFEAYLERYPEGHFASLARNRIKTLATPKPAPRPAAPPPPPPAAAKAPPTENRAPPPRPATPPPAQRAPSPPPPPVSAARIREQRVPREGGLNIGLIAAILVVLGAAGGGVWFWLNMPHEKATPSVSTAAASPASATDEHRLTAAAPETAEQTATTSPPAEQAPAPDATAPATTQPLVVAEASGLAPGASPPAASSSAASSPAPVNAKGTIKDCAECPELAVLPGGKYQMGSPKDEPGRYGYEGPQHEVTLAPFAIAKQEVTFDQWDACVADGGCNGFKPADRGWGRGNHPVIGVSWSDANAYAQWLSKKTGRHYRLPSEAEWEYAERGGTNTAYWWGPYFDGSRAPHGQPSPAGSFAPNAFGLYDMVGNAAEWVEDCYQSNYVGAPSDGSAITGACENRAFRGGSYKSAPTDLRSANRGRNAASTRAGYMGFRVAATP